MSNDTTKILAEYHAELAADQKIWLKIRFTPGMETLAQELSTGKRIFEQDWNDYKTSSTSDPFYQPPYTEASSPEIFPTDFSPALYSPEPNPPYPSPAPRPVITRRRSQHWMLDASATFPTLFIEEDLVSFYSDLAELRQGMTDRGPEGRNKIIINIANVVSIEKVLTRRSYAQNISYADVIIGNRYQEPSVSLVPLSIASPTEIPLIQNYNQELAFPINVIGGVAPYKFHMLNQPPDLYVTEDGWVRGFIEQDQWVLTGYREFLILLVVEDSSIPVQTAGLEFRYRLYPSS